jgi:hypothetical protein
LTLVFVLSIAVSTHAPSTLRAPIRLSNVPEVTIFLRIVKVPATTLGETAAGSLATNRGLEFAILPRLVCEGGDVIPKGDILPHVSDFAFGSDLHAVETRGAGDRLDPNGA